MATTACCQRGVRQRGMAARAVEQLAAALREWIGKGLGSCTVGGFLHVQLRGGRALAFRTSSLGVRCFQKRSWPR